MVPEAGTPDRTVCKDISPIGFDVEFMTGG